MFVKHSSENDNMQSISGRKELCIYLLPLSASNIKKIKIKD